MSAPKDVVARGYDAVSRHYRADDEEPPHYGGWLAEIGEHLPPQGRVLDLGCGCGVPLLRDLDRAGP